MKYILILAIYLLPDILSAQEAETFTVDKDSNAILVDGADTFYLQTVSATRKLDFMGKGTTLIPRDKNYKYNPHFRGSIITYLDDNLQYPEEAVKKGIEGDVRLFFDVDEQGKISNIEKRVWGVDDTPHPILVKEAVRIVENMPPWQPARSREDGITPVKSKGGLTVPFRLY